ncbi:SDR family NAD(P)-dependent oxidoreductase [Solirubrobacter sp. CPCC 204708]|uniref:SDR family NAD(P)-dependent oxidoreductase n=1 Tax=Solirubrobacter deserti TaxID=2282478 RepID=A0ABT4RQC7_9ACTN|nr:SDR family NAD(P)-dependent oxidoreductase [Solirubrobacter deserti]MBE2320470.1 SDR family NAD(P)-dependent oxidoreductase [Solirubrobacter deserti]MDA0140717.1 SDR family NAD(P)-dependent oxidoreductase [Solirubrobacter deserti]
MSRTVVVIGASSGIGLETARAFLGQGDRVHAAARRSIDLEGVVPHRLDFTDRDAVDAFAAEFDGVDALIVAAGTNIKERRLHELTHEGWDTVVGANLNGPFNALRAFLPALRAAHGTVVFIGSVSGAWTDRSGPAYQAAKAGLLALTRAVGFEASGEIRSTIILPGVVDTEILDNRPEPPPREVRDQMLMAEDVAAACVFAVNLPPRAFIPELTILPTALQAIGKTT